MTIAVNLLSTIDWGAWVTSSTGMGECVFAIIVMLFIKQAEPIVRRIFGFDNAGSLGSALASGALLMGSIKTASNVIDNVKNKKVNSAKSGKTTSSKPQASSNATRNATNINNATKNTNANKTQNAGASQNAGAKASNGQNTGGTNTNSQNQSGNRNLNTSPKGGNLTQEEKKQRVKDGIKKFVGTGVGVGIKSAGLAMGAFASDDPITGAMTGYNYGKTFDVGAKSLGGTIANTGKTLVNKATRRKKLIESTNNLIDEYNKLQAKTKWNDNLIYRKSEALLQVSDLNKVSDPDIRKYGETLHKYRKAFEEKYEAPTDMVLDAINKIQSGELEKTEESIKRYTRKK